MARLLVIALACAAATLVAVPAEAQWKWRDKTGRVQYSDLPPPPGTSDGDILARPAAANRRSLAVAAAPASAASAASGVAAASSAARGNADPELEARKKKADADQAARAKADEQKFLAAKADNCTRARAALTTLESGIRLARANAQGEREFIDDKQRAEETRRTREVIANDCR